MYSGKSSVSYRSASPQINSNKGSITNNESTHVETSYALPIKQNSRNEHASTAICTRISAILVPDNDRSSFIEYLVFNKRVGIRTRVAFFPVRSIFLIYKPAAYRATALVVEVSLRKTPCTGEKARFTFFRLVAMSSSLYSYLEGVNYLTQVPMYLVPVYIFPTRRAMKILLALGRLPRRVRPSHFVLSPRIVPVGSEVVRVL